MQPWWRYLLNIWRQWNLEFWGRNYFFPNDFSFKLISVYLFFMCASSRRTGQCPERVPLPTPASNYGMKKLASQPTSSNKSVPYYSGFDNIAPSVRQSSYSTSRDSQVFNTWFLFVNIRSSNVFPVSFIIESNEFCTNVICSHFSWIFFQVCPICLTEPKNMAFSCGHQVNIETWKCSFDQGYMILNNEHWWILNVDLLWVWTHPWQLSHLSNPDCHKNPTLLISTWSAICHEGFPYTPHVLHYFCLSSCTLYWFVSIDHHLS